MRKMLIALFLLSTLLFGTVAAADTNIVYNTYQEGDFTYILDNGKATITEIAGNPAALVIPDLLGGYPVASIVEGVPYDFMGMTLIVCMLSEKTTSVTLPACMTNLSEGVFASAQLNTITLMDGNPVYCLIDGVLFDGVQRMLHTYPAGFDAASYQIPAGTQKIGHHAFYDCGFLTSVIIPQSVTAIDEEAFTNCEQLTLSVPDGSYAQEYAIAHSLPYRTESVPAKVDATAMFDAFQAQSPETGVSQAPQATQTASQSETDRLQTYPDTGTVLYENGEARVCPLKIVNESNYALIIKLSVFKWIMSPNFTANQTENVAIAFFVRPNETAEVNVPQGEFQLTYVGGMEWTRTDDQFGFLDSNAVSFTESETWPFTPAQSRTVGLRIDSDGNWAVDTSSFDEGGTAVSTEPPSVAALTPSPVPTPTLSPTPSPTPSPSPSSVPSTTPPPTASDASATAEGKTEFRFDDIRFFIPGSLYAYSRDNVSTAFILRMYYPAWADYTSYEDWFNVCPNDVLIATDPVERFNLEITILPLDNARVYGEYSENELDTQIIPEVKNIYEQTGRIYVSVSRRKGIYGTYLVISSSVRGSDGSMTYCYTYDIRVPSQYSAVKNVTYTLYRYGEPITLEAIRYLIDIFGDAVYNVS